jgi:hypothetical protein
MEVIMKSGDLEIIFFEIWENLGYFIHEQCISWNHIFKVEIWWNFANKRNADSM